ncbi:MAG: 3-hydroxyacyl-[acyl-carrier-protein] dehydratase FabA [Colwellia sp.]|nr:3-hydroxyacyl-[acyl-carrier-protein] dehydratase FabA [Colwellia sp.]
MEDIAVVGIANLFPGSSAPEEFWQKMLNKEDCRSKATAEQMGVDPDKYYGKKGEDDKFYCIQGGYIRDAQFDSSGFAVASSYLEQMDDLHQWSLTVTRDALKDAGYWQSDALKNCGVILGNLSFPTKSSNHLFMPIYNKVVDNSLKQVLNNDFQLSHFTEHKSVHPDNALVAGYPSALLAKAAKLGGANFSLDAACASSCYSVKLACDYLHTGKANMMLAGAVSGADPMFVNMGFSIFQAYPGNNIHAPFDKTSRGLFAGEGAGMMVLKRHSDAVRDGDTIHAIIKGGALTNDGKGEFVLSPNTKGQVLAYQRAYQDADVNPANVHYVECHATGTPKGDKVELTSMETFFKEYGNKPLLGSVKSNLGHLLTAAGMPGMTKAILSLKHGEIPATINLNQAMNSPTGYFAAEQMPTETVPWPDTKGQAKTAGVSVFGFGGSNAHVVLQEPTQVLQSKFVEAKQSQPLAIIGMDAHFGSAKNLSEFKSLLDNNQNTFRELPTERWKGMETDSSVMAALQLSKAPRGGYVEEFDIDFLRFKVPPNKQDCLIPQQLMMMSVADNAAKDAGLVEGSNVAVLVAMGIELELHQYRGRVNLTTQIEDSLHQQGIHLTVEQKNQLTTIAKDGVASAAQLNQYTSFIGNIMASRISSLWDFSGPAITVSAEENSVYRCVELADNLFRTSNVEAVIVASVDLAGSIENITLRQHFGAVSLNAEPADASQAKDVLAADVLNRSQWLVGEGAAAIVVKPQSDVTADRVYAKINALGFVQGSDAASIEKAAQNALSFANITAADITQIEAHASGFPAENMAEKTALAKLYPAKKISSVKSNIGHTFNASGMASLIKTALLLDDKSSLDDKHHTHMAISGLGKDDNACHVIMSSTQSKHQTAPALANVKKRPALIKNITLGGPSISSSIVTSAAESTAVSSFAQIKQQVIAKTLNAVSRPIDMSNLSPKKLITTAAGPAINLSPIKAQHKPIILTRTAVGTPVKNSVSKEIYQQTATHQAFLKSRQVAQQQISQMISMQAELHAGSSTPELNVVSKQAVVVADTASGFKIKGPVGHDYPALNLIERYNQPTNIIYNQADLVEFAEGDIAKVFGDEYAIIDNYARRVRLPTTDYLLVTRVTDLDAKINEYKKSTMATEYDVPTDAPFLIDGQIPWSVAVESGQCDLMLISYIGIDFQAKSERIYRLLDCELTFKEDMAFGGETLRYEITIDSYARNGDQLLFFFHYDCYVNGKVVLEMRNGCAGFFTDEELADGKGVIHNDADKTQLAEAKKSTFKPLIENKQTEYTYQDMMKLVDGDIAGCFGIEYNQGGRNPSLKFSSEKFLMIERITKIDPQGGHWGLGLLEGQKDLEPDHWYFPCHFKGDEVMAGSLMSEGCGQMAMFFMLWLGMNGNVNNARFQPMKGESQTVRCRGQVIPQSNTLTYRMEVTEMGMHPQPFLKANIDIILDGKVVVDFKNLCIMIDEQTENSPYPVQLPDYVLDNIAQSAPTTVDVAPVAALTTVAETLDETGRFPFAHPTRPLMRVESDLNAPTIKGVTPIKHFSAPDVEGANRTPNTAPFTPWHMFEFATGNISNCFGADFDVYEGRIPPRTPCGELQVVTQVVEVQGTRLDLKKPSSCIAEYYVPEDAWYFTKNSHPSWMPYSLIMEIALQPNGFISGYMGTTLKYPEKDLFFRNLDGTGKLVKQIDLRGKTIVNKSVLVSTSIAGGAIIQSFTFELSVEGDVFYTGKAVFGYFSGESLTNQLGIDNGKITHAWFVDNKTPEKDIEVFDLTNKDLALFKAPEGKPHYRLAGGQMNFIDTVSIVEGGGEGGDVAAVAYIYGERTIDPTDWFFRYHFHQDPVMPGSLGVEAIIELLQTYAVKNNLGKDFTNPRFIAPATEVVWKYRGQITPVNKQMSLDVHITEIIKEKDEIRIIGNANLSKDGLRIYHIKDIVLSIVEA